MSSQPGTPIHAVPDRRPVHFWPQTRAGWWALGLTLATVLYSRVGPGSGAMTDVGKYTRVVGLAILVAVAAYIVIRAIWRERERSVTVILALVVLIATAALWPLFVLGEWLFPH